MSELSEFKNIIVADRKYLLECVATDLKKISNFEEIKKYTSSLVNKGNKYITRSIPPMPDKKRRKELQFRKVSAYLAFCSHFRDSQRNKDGKLTKNVLDITREAGSLWRNMDNNARTPWATKADELTKLAKAEWDMKESEKNAIANNTESKNKNTLYTPEIIKTMKRKDIAKLLNRTITSKDTTEQLRNMLISQYCEEKETNTIPTMEEINKMKKSELVSMAKSLGIELKNTKIKDMQTRLIQHYQN